MIIRMSIDVIAKQSLGIIEQHFFGSTLIGAGEQDWAKFYIFRMLGITFVTVCWRQMHFIMELLPDCFMFW